jgi:methylase of polypeptide subunit release factors
MTGVATAIDITNVTQRLCELGYVEDNLQRRLGFRYPDDIGAVGRVAVVERLRADDDALAVALRLFWLEVDEPAAQVRRALGTAAFSSARRARLLAYSGGNVRARLRAEAYGSLVLWADRRFRGMDAGGLRLGGDNPVYPPSSDSLILAQAVQVPTGAEVLDLCTGSGILALAAAGKARSVLATDISPRAVQVARLNAVSNGISNLVVEQGDLYAAARGVRFDVIVTNPPFVSSPYAGGPSYHAGGATGDRILRRVVSGWSRHLRPDGSAFAISHVGLRQTDDLEAVAHRWLRRFPGRAQLVILERGNAVDLAAAQALFALQRGTGAYAREVGVWLRYLQRHRITEVVAFLLIGRLGSPRSLEIADATPRFLPIPLSKPPAQIVSDWLAPQAVRPVLTPSPAIEPKITRR